MGIQYSTFLFVEFFRFSVFIETSKMKASTNIPENYLDIIFANRNKAYLAYELRKNYDRRMLISFAILISAVISAILMNANLDSTEKIVYMPATLDVPVNLTKIIIDPVQKKAEQQQSNIKGTTAKTTSFADPKIVKDLGSTASIAKLPKADALAGPVDNPGLKDGTAIALDKSLHDGSGKASVSSDGADNNKSGGSDIDDQKVHTHIEQMPRFPGGEQALRAYLQKSLNYPKVAAENNVQGRVFVTFVVNGKGEIEDIKVVRGIGSGCDAEAMRVVRNMPKWEPGIQNNKPVKVKMTLPVNFILE